MSFVLERILDLLFYIVVCCVVYRCARFVYNVFRAVYVYRIAPLLGIKFNFEPYATKWTVITGPTDGIGKAYTFELAKQGLRKFILVSRDISKLESTAKELKAAYPSCEIEVLPFTFGKDDYEKIKSFVEPLDIGILVNNAGCAPVLMYRFAEDPSTDRQIYKVNTESIFEMMQIVLPKMQKARTGVIVNMASLQSVRPIILLASYSASKAYVSYLTDCIYREYASDGIRVQCLIPILVATKMTQYDHSNIPLHHKYIVVEARHYAKEAVSSLGITHYTTGCFSHEIQLALLYILPWWLLRYIANPYYRMHQRRLLREQQKKMKAD